MCSTVGTIIHAAKCVYSINAHSSTYVLYMYVGMVCDIPLKCLQTCLSNVYTFCLYIAGCVSLLKGHVLYNFLTESFSITVSCVLLVDIHCINVCVLPCL